MMAATLTIPMIIPSWAARGSGAAAAIDCEAEAEGAVELKSDDKATLSVKPLVSRELLTGRRTRCRLSI
jgi:hypothetical protein